jgi:hypothetical protein
MADSAKVSSLDAIRDFKVALLSFAEDATVALSEATSDAQRSLWYITVDCKAHWQRELKKRNEKLNQAKAELFKKQLETSDTRTSAVVERKAVARWEAAVNQAEEKLRAIKRWATELERQFMIFKAGVQGISNIVAGDLPTAAARMQRMIVALEQYIQLQAPSGTSQTLPASALETLVTSEAAPPPAHSAAPTAQSTGSQP